MIACWTDYRSLISDLIDDPRWDTIELPTLSNRAAVLRFGPGEIVCLCGS